MLFNVEKNIRIIYKKPVFTYVVSCPGKRAIILRSSQWHKSKGSLILVQNQHRLQLFRQMNPRAFKSPLDSGCQCRQYVVISLEQGVRGICYTCRSIQFVGNKSKRDSLFKLRTCHMTMVPVKRVYSVQSAIKLIYMT